MGCRCEGRSSLDHGRCLLMQLPTRDWTWGQHDDGRCCCWSLLPYWSCGFGCWTFPYQINNMTSIELNWMMSWFVLQLSEPAKEASISLRSAEFAIVTNSYVKLILIFWREHVHREELLAETLRGSVTIFWREHWWRNSRSPFHSPLDLSPPLPYHLRFRYLLFRELTIQYRNSNNANGARYHPSICMPSPRLCGSKCYVRGCVSVSTGSPLVRLFFPNLNLITWFIVSSTAGCS